MRTFDELVAEADAADVTGWGFDWLAGRASEERPPWGYSRMLAERLAVVASALDIDVWILRKCVWWVPDFTVARYRATLLELDRGLRAGRPFVAHSTRHLIEARR